MKRTALTLALLAAGGLSTTTAAAQQYLMAGSAEVATGQEGAGHGLRRARTRLRVGLELRIDESPDDGIVFAGLVDIEPKTAFGGELRYLHMLTPRLSVSAGGIAYLAPGTLLGGCADFEARLPFGKKLFLIGGPEATVFVVGSDLPNNSIVWQGLLQIGLRADL